MYARLPPPPPPLCALASPPLRSPTHRGPPRRSRSTNAGFCCKLEDNTFKLDFLAFFIKDYDTRRMIFSIDRDTAPPLDFSKIDLRNFDMNTLRQIDYNFDVEVLRLERLTTRCVGAPRSHGSTRVLAPPSLARALALAPSFARAPIHPTDRACRCSSLTHLPPPPRDPTA